MPLLILNFIENRSVDFRRTLLTISPEAPVRPYGLLNSRRRHTIMDFENGLRFMESLIFIFVLLSSSLVQIAQGVNWL